MLSHCSGYIIVLVVLASCVDISSWPIWDVLANTINCAIDCMASQLE